MRNRPLAKIPTTAPIPIIGNLSAPFVYFDRVAAQGTHHGVVHFELVAVTTVSDGQQTATQIVTTAHLRCSLAALENLKQSIAGIELMRAPASTTEN